MDIWQILTIGVRRWRITVPLALAGIAFAWVFSASVSPIYKAEGSLLYLPPSANVVDVSGQAATDPASPEFDPTIETFVETRNPFAGSLRSAVLAAELYMQSRGVEREFDDLGLSTQFSVLADSRNAVLYLSADASSPDVAIGTVHKLLDIALEDLSSRQDAFGVDPLERVTAQTVTRDEIAVIDLGGRMRVRAILLILAILLAFGIAVAIEGYQDHRRNQRQPNQGSPDSASDEADAAAESSSSGNSIRATGVGDKSQSPLISALGTGESSQPGASFVRGA